MGCKAPEIGDGEALTFWDLSSDGQFTLASAYELLYDNGDADTDKLWQRIWKWKGAQRVRIFLWLAARDSLLTNAVRRR